VIEVLENGKEIEVSLEGTLYGVESASENAQIDFVGTRDLAIKLSSTEAIHNCLVRKGFRFITGLPASHEDFDAAEPESLTRDEEEDYACATDTMKSALMSSNESPREMFKQLGSSELIRFRK